MLLTILGLAGFTLLAFTGMWTINRVSERWTVEGDQDD